MDNNQDSITSPEQEENERQSEANAQKDLDVIRAYKSVFNSAEGKRILYDLMKSCCFRESTFTIDTSSMAFNEGRRSVMLDILKILRKEESDIIDFLHESSKREKEYFV